LVFKLAVKAKF